MPKKEKRGQFRPKALGERLQNSLRNDSEEWDVIKSDVLGSYTGTGYMDDYPVQDGDDL